MLIVRAVLRAVQGTGSSGSIRPHYTGASVYDAAAGFFLNSLAYTAPLAGHWGDAGRNSIIGPGQFSVNAQMMRTFRINDRINADLRIDASNVLNHVTYQSWNTIVSSTQFGLPTTANQLAALRSGRRGRLTFLQRKPKDTGNLGKSH